MMGTEGWVSTCTIEGDIYGKCERKDRLRETLKLAHLPRRPPPTPPEPASTGYVALLDDRLSASSRCDTVPVGRWRTTGVEVAVEEGVGLVASPRGRPPGAHLTARRRRRRGRTDVRAVRVHLVGGDLSRTTTTATVSSAGRGEARLRVVSPGGSVVDLVAGHLVRGGGGAGTDAEEETKGVGGEEARLEVACDGARGADEGDGGDEGRSVVAGGGLEAPDGSAVRRGEMSTTERRGRGEERKRTRWRCRQRRDRERPRGR